MEKLLDSILANDYPKEKLEVLIVDGMSDDGTRNIIKTYTVRYGFIILLDNPNKITPIALNIGVINATGDVIMRMDAHAEYKETYISGLVSALTKSGADNVGGVCINRPGKNTVVAEAIAIALAHPFGVGSSYFRINVVSKSRWVDTVPYGCYHRSVFDRIGLFDEELVRNQDDEFNARLIKNGGKILLLPNISSYYYTRDSVPKLWKMYYQYGYFKPLVIRKIGWFFTVRQVVPATVIILIFGLALLSVWFNIALHLEILLLTIYFVVSLSISAVIASQTRLRHLLVLPLVFLTLHLAYGLGFLKGAIDFLLFWRRVSDPRTQSLSR